MMTDSQREQLRYHAVEIIDKALDLIRTVERDPGRFGEDSIHENLNVIQEQVEFAREVMSR